MLETLRSRPAVARAAAAGVRAGARRPRSASSTCRRCRAAPPGCTWPCARPGSSRATRWSRRRSASWPRPTAILYEGARPVFCDIDPRTLNIDPDAAAAAVGERTAGLLPVHIFGYPADMPAFERARRASAGSGSWRTPARRSAPCTPTARRSAPAGNLGRVRLLPEQAADDGGGRSGGLPGRRGQGAHRLRAQPGPRAGHGLARPRPPRASTTACRTSPARSASRSSSGSTSMLAARARVAGLYGEALAGVEGLELPCPDADGDRRSWFVYVVQLPPAWTATATMRALRERGVDSKPYLPGDPPDELLPRALRPPRGRVPGLRGRRRAARSRCLSSPELTDGAGRARGGDAGAVSGVQSYGERHGAGGEADSPSDRPRHRSRRASPAQARTAWHVAGAYARGPSRRRSARAALPIVLWHRRRSAKISGATSSARARVPRHAAGPRYAADRARPALLRPVVALDRAQARQPPLPAQPRRVTSAGASRSTRSGSRARRADGRARAAYGEPTLREPP